MKNTAHLQSFLILFAVTLVLAGCKSVPSSDAPSSNTQEQEAPSMQAIYEDESDAEAAVNKDVMEPPSLNADDTNEDAPAVTQVYEIGSLQPYDQVKFEAAKAGGKKILLDFYASWCPTCRANDPIIKEGLTGADVVAFRVDYDNASDLKKQYKVTTQSTYILLQNEAEERVVGSLSEASFSSLIGS